MNGIRAAGVVGLLAVFALVAGPQPARANPPVGQVPSQLVFSAQPTTVAQGARMSPAVLVLAQDAHGDLVDYNGTVSLSIAGGAALPGTPTGNAVTAVGGVATFPALMFPGVGFGVRLTAIAGAVTSAPSNPFDVVGQVVSCLPGRSCHTESVTSQGTSGSASTPPASTAGMMTATGGGFPALSCTSRGGVLTFDSDRAQQITVSMPSAHGRHQAWDWMRICAGDPAPFRTIWGTMSRYNAANGDYEGVLPVCWPWQHDTLCVKYWHRSGNTDYVVINAPAGDPHITF